MPAPTRLVLDVRVMSRAGHVTSVASLDAAVMSLVALLRFGSSVLLLGDVLLTRDGEEAHHAFDDLPAVASLDTVLPKDWYISVTALREKVLLVSNQLAIGWVGSLFKAESVVRALRKRCSSATPNSQELAAMLEEEVEAVGLSCELTGWLRDGGDWRGFRWKSDSPRSFVHVDECFLGTGADALRSLLTRPQALTQSGPAIQRAAAVAALFGLEESLTGATIRARFGGGVQVIYDEGDELRALESLTIVLALVTPEGDLRFASRILKYGRSNGVSAWSSPPSSWGISRAPRVSLRAGWPRTGHS